jgi:hypothetical protein
MNLSKRAFGGPEANLCQKKYFLALALFSLFGTRAALKGEKSILQARFWVRIAFPAIIK